MADYLVQHPDRPGTYLLPWTAGPREDDAQRREPAGIIRRHLRLIVACIVLVAGVAAVLTARITPVYEATASLQIDEEDSGLTGVEILQDLAIGSGVETEMEVLATRALAETIIDSLRLQVQLGEPKGVSRSDLLADIRVARNAVPASYALVRQADGRFRLENRETTAALGTFAVGQRVAVDSASFLLAPAAAQYEELTFSIWLFDDALDALRESVDVSRPSREANVVAVTYRGTDPEIVRDVPNVLAMQFMAQRQHARRTEARSTVRFLRTQLDTLRRQLAVSEDALREFREGERVVNPEEEANVQVSRVAELQAQRSSIDAERSSLAKLLSEVREAAEKQRDGEPSPYRNLLAFPTLLRNQAASALLSSLAAAEDRRTELMSRRSTRDPDVQVLSARIEQLENQLHSITVTYLKGLTDQLAAVDATLARSQRALERIPQKELRFARLQREPQTLQEIYTLLYTRLKEAEIGEAVEDATVRVVDAASLPRSPVQPKPLLNMALAIVTGLLLGLAGAFAREYRDKSVHTRKEVQAATGIPVLGLIPRARRSRWSGRLRGAGRGSKRVGSGGGDNGREGRRDSSALDGDTTLGARQGLLAGVDPRSPIAEAYSRLETNVAFARQDGAAKTLVLTSPLPGDGKTTIAINLAITLAQRGQRVLLIDADLRRGVINTLLGSRREPGLSNVLLGTVSVRDALRTVDVGEGATLYFLTTGKLPPNPAQLLASSRPRALLESLAGEYDSIILDSPPLNVVTDAALLGTSSDGVVLVARSGVTAPEALAFAMEQLRAVRAPVLGAILNDIDFERDASYDGAYKYYGHDIAYFADAPK